MNYDFLVSTYQTERLKVLSVWSMFRDEDLNTRPHPADRRGRSVREQMLHYAYIRREAVLSSQIEGTQSTLADLLLFELEESPGVPFDDVAEVSGYVAALEHGVDRLREGFPLSNRLIREMHAIAFRTPRQREVARRVSPDSERIGGIRRATPILFRRRLIDLRTAWPPERFIHDEHSPYPT